MTTPNGIAPDHPGPEPPAPHQLFDTILVLDFGSQYTHLITRRLRELNIYSELLPCTQKLAELDWKPKGVILSGGPYSVYAADAPHVDPAVFELGVPILGICYGLQEMAWHHGKDVAAGEKKEYGRTELNIQRHGSGGEQKGHVDTLFANWEEPLEKKKKAETKSEAEEEDDDDDNKDEPEDEAEVWMSHGDKLSRMPDGFVTIATTANAPFAGIAHVDKPYYGIQFHPEVTHTPRGTRLIRNFAVGVCRAQQNWTMESFVDQEIERIRKLVGEKGQVLGAVSGGVDSTVAAKLMQAAIGDRFHAVLVDNGVMRLNEAKQVEETLTRGLGINLTVVDASELFLSRLAGVSDPEKKRKIIGNTFIDVFQEKATEIAEAAKNTPRAGDIEWFLQGTLYPDVIESISFKGPSATIKTHHNVGGLPEKMRLKLIEPLRELFKDEVRALGRSLGIPEELVMRHPFPGPGIAIRVIGEVTPERIRIAQKADKIFIDEIRAAGLYGKISQAFAGVFGVKSVGVVGDQRLHGDVIALRAVRTTDFMTAKSFRFKHKFLERVSNRIANEVDGVARVFYETTSKPPATIELE